MYIGQTGRELKERYSEHIKIGNTYNALKLLRHTTDQHHEYGNKHDTMEIINTGKKGLSKQI